MRAIFWLQVAVNNANAVTVRNGDSQLQDDLRRPAGDREYEKSFSKSKSE